MLRKACLQADFKLDDDGPGSFSGYASTFNDKDRAGEIVVKGAFKKSLEAFKRDGFIAVGHDWDGLPVATLEDAYEDEKGLFIKCVYHSTPEAQAARTVAKERKERGKSVGLSIGYSVKDSEPTSKGLLLKEIELFEVSLVTVPCNPNANATRAKSLETKGEALGLGVECGMALAACYEGTNALWWAIQDALYFTDGSKDDRLGLVDAALKEFHGLVLTTLSALYPEDLPEDAKQAVIAEMKRLWPQPTDTADLPARTAFEKQLSEALAAVEACTARAGEIADLREKDGRTLSVERREQFATMQARLADLAEKTKPAADPALAQSALIEHLRRKQARREAAVGS